MYIAYYDLFRSCKPNNAVLFLVLSIFVGVTTPFFLFFNRKKDGGMPPRCDVPQAPVNYVPETPVQEAEPAMFEALVEEVPTEETEETEDTAEEAPAEETEAPVEENEVPAEERAKMIEAEQPLYDQYASEFGVGDVIDKLLELGA